MRDKKAEKEMKSRCKHGNYGFCLECDDDKERKSITSRDFWVFMLMILAGWGFTTQDRTMLAISYTIMFSFFTFYLDWKFQYVRKINELIDKLLKHLFGKS